MSSSPETPPEQASVPNKHRRDMRDLVHLGLKGGMLMAAVMVSMIAIVILVPDGSDYAETTSLKHRRLAQAGSPKIVLVGGSNQAYGTDSKMIERATGCPVVNMGMNGFLGVRYMLEEVRPYLHPSDIVVVAFEWDFFYSPVDGTASALFALVRARPEAFTYLSPKQKLRVLLVIPDVAQQKVMRLLREGIAATKDQVTGGHSSGESTAMEFILNIETLRGFTPEGDLVRHLGVTWPFKRDGGVIPESEKIEIPMIDMLRDFTVEMNNRDIAVMLSYSPAIRYFYDRYQRSFEEVHGLVQAMPPLIAPSSPANYSFDVNYFFDSVYHLNAEGRKLRTQRLIDDLQSQWPERANCAKPAIAAPAVQSGKQIPWSKAGIGKDPDKHVVTFGVRHRGQSDRQD